MKFTKSGFAGALSALALMLAPAGSAMAQSASAVQVSYRITSEWGAGFCGAITVANTGSAAVNGWSGSFTLANGKINQLWNASWSQSGSTVTVSGMGWNKDLAAGASISSVGFCADRASIASSSSSQSSSAVSSSAASSSASSSSSVAVSSSSSSSRTSSSAASSASSSASSASSSSVSSSSAASSVASSSVSSSAQSSASSSAASSAPAYTAVSTQYVHEGITTANSLYMDSAHFRVYYGGSGKNGGGILGTHTTAQVTQVLDYLEAAYDYWITQRGFRSPGQPVAGRSGGPFKINVYAKANIDAGGYMGYDGRSGLSFVIVNSNSIGAPSVYVHEFGHCITLSEYLWVDKAVTGAWWEATAQWHTDDFMAFAPQHAAVAVRHGRASASTLFDVNTVIGRSHLTLVHANNLYQAWPFLSYLNANPDGYSGLGVNAVRTLYRSHQGSQTETPLHTLARMVSSTTWQRVVGSYWARMAYLDIKHPLAQQRLMASINNASFRASAYRNLSAAGENTYRVITARQPMYGGANINPLTVTASNIGITVKNLGNGLADSNFTATLAIRNTANGSVRYVQLPNGVGSASIASGEEVSLVVANTPNNLYVYNAFESTATSPDRIGLNYEVVMTGARPRDL